MSNKYKKLYDGYSTIDYFIKDYVGNILGVYNDKQEALNHGKYSDGIAVYENINVVRRLDKEE